MSAMSLDVCSLMKAVLIVANASKLANKSKYLTLAGTRHFAILHGTRGLVRPPSRLAPE